MACSRNKSCSMEGVSHSFVHTNGIRMHIVEKGSGPTVLLLHGFPECWYSWRHQINALADAGYRVVAPDMRGYGESDAPEGSSSYTSFHIVGDLIGLLDQLKQEKVFLAAHDWGALIAWDFCLFRPDRVHALVALSVQYTMRNPLGSMLSTFRRILGEDFYMCKFQKPGQAEAQFASIGITELFKNIFSTNSIIEGQLYTQPMQEQETLQSCLTEDDLKFYVGQYEKNGFIGPLNYYRAIELSWKLKAPWTGKTLDVPSIFIIGDRDITYKFPGAKEYIHGGSFAKAVTKLENIIVIEDAGHFIHEEKPHVINDHVVKFFNKFLDKI